MSTYVIISKERKATKELLLKLEGSFFILNCDLVEPLNNESDNENSNLDTSEEIFTNQSDFNNIKLLNPALARNDRRKALASWLIPFGFIAGLSFSQMTDLKTFADMGFPKSIRKDPWWPSWNDFRSAEVFSAGGINQETVDDLRAIRKKVKKVFGC